MVIIAICTEIFSPGGYKSITTCEEMIFTYNLIANASLFASLYTRYPACVGYNVSTMGDVYVIVNASLNREYPEEKAALLNMVFGASGWVAGVVHLILTEVYLNYTKDEDERLKKISIVRRRAAGLEVGVEMAT
jgi:hypothetical protein